MGKEGVKYAPFIGTLFFFILFSNLIGLIPGALPGTGHHRRDRDAGP
jgi:F-type H+-transporting ATPase subunit a